MRQPRGFGVVFRVSELETRKDSPLALTRSGVLRGNIQNVGLKALRLV